MNVRDDLNLKVIKAIHKGSSLEEVTSIVLSLGVELIAMHGASLGVNRSDVKEEFHNIVDEIFDSLKEEVTLKDLFTLYPTKGEA